MAGEIEQFVFPSLAFKVKPAKSLPYHEGLMSSKSSVKVMDNFLPSQIDEDAFLHLLFANDAQGKALKYLDEHLQKNNGKLIFHDRQSLFEGFAKILVAANQKVCIHCTKLISKIIPHLGDNVDKHMNQVMSAVISNVGGQSVTLQKESIQMLYVYMKHTLDMYQILNVIAREGIQHKNSRTRQQIIRIFPTLLFTEFKSEDFFDIIHSLVTNLSEIEVESNLILQVLNKVSDFIGKDMFSKYINRLPSTHRHTYFRCSAENEKRNNSDALPPNLLHDQNSNVPRKYSLSMIENFASVNKETDDFEKSTYFEKGRRHRGQIYSSVGALPSYDSKMPTRDRHIAKPDQLPHFELSFIPRYIIEQMSNPEHSLRLQAVEELKDILINVKEAILIKENMVPLLSLLQPVFDDKNHRVACGALRAFSIMIAQIGSDISNYLKLFVFAISRKLGNIKDAVRSECYKVLLQIMDLVGRQKVLNLFWDKLAHKQYKVREDFMCVVIATLLTSLKSKNYSDLDFEMICNHVAGRLTDNQQAVRHAALDCIAVLGHILGTANKKLLSAIDNVELKYDNASGIMSAVHARLLRKQLPRLNEKMLVEYAIFPSTGSSVSSPLGADLQWILAADKPKKSGSSTLLYGSLDKDSRQFSVDELSTHKDSALPSKGNGHPARRHVSAGKQRQFPWSSQEDLSSRKLPISAPNNSGYKQGAKQLPPFQPRNTWGPESETPKQVISLPMKSRSIQGHETNTPNSGPSYQEIYKRRKEAQNNKNSTITNLSSAPNSSKSVLLQLTKRGVPEAIHNEARRDRTLAHACPMSPLLLLGKDICQLFLFVAVLVGEMHWAHSAGAVEGSDSGYQPSFASKNFSASSADSQSNALLDSPSLSNSCPSSFFDKNSSATSRRLKKKVILPSDEIAMSSGYGSTESAAPIRLKPALARSASKRRDNMVAASREFLRSDDNLENVPLKLKNSSASPRFDRWVANAAEQSRPSLKAHHNHLPLSGSEKFPGPISSKENSESGYYPTGILRKPEVKDPSRSDVGVRHSLTFEDSTLPPKSNRVLNENNSSNQLSNDTKSRHVPKPIVPSNFSPVRHKNHDDTTEFQLNSLNSIRRSAQNKRERMRSRPGSEDGFSNSFSEFSTGNKSTKDQPSSHQQDQCNLPPTIRSSSQPVTSNEITSTATPVSPDPPSFKYNPNAGVTFESKKTDPTVSIVGVRYPSQAFIGSSTPPDTKSTNTTGINSSSGVNFSKFSPNSNGSERNKSHRGSTLGVSISPDATVTRTFNVQGKGVFMSPSTVSISGNDFNELVTTSAKDEHHSKPSSGERNKEQSKILSGVQGVAVKQPSLSPQEFLSQGRGASDVQVSLSASLRERKERQREALSKSLFYGDDDSSSSFSNLKIESPEGFGAFHESINTKARKDGGKSNKAATLPRRSTESARRAMFNTGVTPKSDSASSSSALPPLDNPEKGLNEAVLSLDTATSEQWEVVTQAMYTIRRLATHHPYVITPRFHDVIIVLNKHVPSLRSQVSKASVQTITDLYKYLKKPAVDTDLDATVRALLLEHGKQMSFIKNETNKTLQAIVNVASTNKTLNAILNTGLRHKSKGVRNTASKFCAKLVDKMGPGKALSGVKDTTDRLLEAVAAFVNDGSPDVRYYGRYIINELMVHDEFMKCVDRCLSPDNAQLVKTAANNIRQRGLGSLSSVGTRSGRSRNGVASDSGSTAGAERFSPSTSAHGRRKGGRAFNEQEQEELKTLCEYLSRGNNNDRKSAIENIFNKIQNDRRFVEENIVKIMDAFMSMLTTAQPKLNFIGLDSLPKLIVNLHHCFRDVTHQLVPTLLKLVASKQHSELALNSINCLVKFVEPLWLIQLFAKEVKHTNTNSKPTAINVLTKLIEPVARKKPKIIDNHVLPVLWFLLTTQGGSGGAHLRKETAALSRTLFGVMGQRLMQSAETQNVSAELHMMLNLSNS